jgi:DNA-binding transcriptional regulator YhcF (GntR family)
MLQMSGWIRIDRDITSHWIFKDEWKFRNWIDLLTLVNHSEQKVNLKGTVLTCKRGQTLCSLDTLAKRWNCDKSKVRRFLKLLESDSMIELKSEHITTRLTICKYDTYQGERNADETQVKHKRNASETQMTPNKNEKNEKNNKYSFLASLLEHGFDEKLSLEWMEVRKQLKAVNTETAFNSFMNQVEKHGGDRNHILRKCVERSWKGFNANWLEKENDRLLTALKNN